tara:strand:+ start:322 stop:633 length:312 start_codon:yes stop_codon:yes gene_type:complete
MKNIFKAVSTFFDDAFFQAPRLQLNQGQKDLLADKGYKVCRSMAPYTMAILSIHTPLLEFDLVQHANGKNLNAEEYQTVNAILEAQKNIQLDNGTKPTNSAPK